MGMGAQLASYAPMHMYAHHHPPRVAGTSLKVLAAPWWLGGQCQKAIPTQPPQSHTQGVATAVIFTSFLMMIIASLHHPRTAQHDTPVNLLANSCREVKPARADHDSGRGPACTVHRGGRSG